MTFYIFIPILCDETVNNLGADSQQSDIRKRGAALETLAKTVVHHRDHLHDLLAIFSRHLNESDPVREKMFAGLLKLPPSIWKNSDLIDVAPLFKATLTSTDSSKGTLLTVFGLLIRLLPSQPDFACPLITETTRMHGFFGTLFQFDDDYDELGLTVIERYLITEDVQKLARSLLPALESWIERQKFAELIDCLYQQ